jgi:hypothetical protein
MKRTRSTTQRLITGLDPGVFRSVVGGRPCIDMIYGLDRYARCRVCKRIVDDVGFCDRHYRRCAWCQEVLPIAYFEPTGYLCRGCRT